MEIESFSIKLPMKAESTASITDKIKQEVKQSGAINGYVVLFAKGSTCALTTMEYEQGVIKDVFDAFESFSPKAKKYSHMTLGKDNNGRSHVRAAIMSPSLTITITKGELDLGSWQQVVLFNLDTKDREREVAGKIVFE